MASSARKREGLSKDKHISPVGVIQEKQKGGEFSCKYAFNMNMVNSTMIAVVKALRGPLLMRCSNEK